LTPYYVPPLDAFANQLGISPTHLAAGFGDPLHFADYFDFDELAKLKASYGPARAPVRRDGLTRLMTTV